MMTSLPPQILWILDADGEPAPTQDLLKYSRLYFDPRRIIAQTVIAAGLHVSTIFLGIDMGFGLTDAPLLWETRVIDDRPAAEEAGLDGFGDRYSSRDDAIIGHNLTVAALRRVQSAAE